MVSSDKMYLLGVNTFQGQQQADGFDRMATSVNKIPQKDIVEIFNVLSFSVLVRSSIKSKETHEISELSMNIPKNLQRRLGLKDHRLTSYDFF